MNWGRVLLVVAFAASAGSAACAQAPDPNASLIWQKVHADLFGGAPIDTAQGVIALETPPRAEDAALHRPHVASHRQ